jgi:hypothetical protein
MKFRKLFILSLVGILYCFNPIYAKKIDVNLAKQVAMNFYTEKYNAAFHTSLKSVSVSETFEVKDNAATVFYVFNMSNNGFIMVAADDIVLPVLGYSFEGLYNDQNLPPEFIDLVNNFKRQITSDVAAQLSSTPQINAEWVRLNKTSNDFASSKGVLTTITSGPLCISTWDQGCCYDALCPVDSSTASVGVCNHAVTGCVATSMAQVMYYYRYPLQGNSSSSYCDCTSSGYANNYGTLSANYGATNYDWTAMTPSCSGTNTAIATLIYHCGVAIKMDYGPAESAGNMNAAVTAFKNYFKYSTTIKSANKSSYTQAAWDTLMATEINAKRPMIYSGTDPSVGGHAWVCDGYQFDQVKYYFHMNWGWSGQSDGYFLTSDLNPSSYNFSQYNSLIYNIYPASGYPYYCSSATDTLSSPVGSFEDGSGSSDYQDNNDCTWLIAPFGAGHINMTFNSFSLADVNDILTIYNGSNASAPVLATYTYGSVIPTSAISSTSSTVFLKFTTDGSGTSSGWNISYTTSYPVYCTGITTLTAPSDSLSDGSGIYNYNNLINCKWQIMPTGAGSVTLHFTSFNTELNNDKVKVTDLVNGTILGIFSGTTIPADVTSPSGQMYIQFTTNATITAAGWSATYNSTVSGIEEYNSIKELAVYPNPAKDKIHISFRVEGSDNATLEIVNLTGQTVYSQKVNSLNGAFSKDIDMSTVAKGIYNLKILTTKETINKKIVLE